MCTEKTQSVEREFLQRHTPQVASHSDAAAGETFPYYSRNVPRLLAIHVSITIP